MSRYNKIMTGPRFTTLDGNILNLIKSFSDSETKFYMSNKELGEVMIADPSTIQRSIDKLVTSGLVKKEIIYIDAKPQRILTCQKEALRRLLDLK
jgi:DNA-binding MarR family transcriptional regulator